MANRFVTTKIAHIFERVGLAMAGASCGLFVAVHLAGTGSEVFMSVTSFFVMTALGAIGFYLGIDIPPHAALTGKIDVAELLSAIGTFLAAISAFVSVYIIVAHVHPQLPPVLILGLLWVLGVTMQIISGTIARIRLR